MPAIENRLKRLEKGKVKGVKLIAVSRTGERTISPADAVTMFDFALQHRQTLTVFHPNADRTPYFDILDAIDYNLLIDDENRLENEAELERRIDAVIRNRIEKSVIPLTDKPLDYFLTPAQRQKAKQMTGIDYTLYCPELSHFKTIDGNLYEALDNMIHGNTERIETAFDILIGAVDDE